MKCNRILIVVGDKRRVCLSEHEGSGHTNAETRPLRRGERVTLPDKSGFSYLADRLGNRIED